MEILYDDKKVKVLFDNFAIMSSTKGHELTKHVKIRYEQLRAAETFYDYYKTGLGKPHRLEHDKNNLYAIRLTGNIRLLVRPVVENEDYSVESLKKCRKVTIIGVEDYHGKKKKSRTYIP